MDARQLRFGTMVTTKILLMGANPAAAFAEGVGGVTQATFSGGVGAAVAAATGGARNSRGHCRGRWGRHGLRRRISRTRRRLCQTTGTAIRGLSGFIRPLHPETNRSVRGDCFCAEPSAEASEAFTSQFAEHARRKRQSRSGI